MCGIIARHSNNSEDVISTSPVLHRSHKIFLSCKFEII